MIPSQFPSFSCNVKREKRVSFLWLNKPNEKKSDFELTPPSLASSFTFYTEKKRLREKEGREPLSLWKLTRGMERVAPQ
jgi:hypothetical protein